MISSLRKISPFSYIVAILIFLNLVFILGFIKANINLKRNDNSLFVEYQQNNDVRVVLHKMALKFSDLFLNKNKILELEKSIKSLGDLEKNVYEKLRLQHQLVAQYLYQDNFQRALEVAQQNLVLFNYIVDNGLINPVEARMEAVHVYADVLVALMRIIQTHVSDNAVINNNSKIALWDDHIDSSSEIDQAIDLCHKWINFDPQSLWAKWYLNLFQIKKGLPLSVDSMGALNQNQSSEVFFKKSDDWGMATPALMAGFLVEDLDNDGWFDILGSRNNPTHDLVYWHNENGKSFVDWTKKSGLGNFPGGLSIVQGDYNNDGFIDVFITRGGWMGDNGQLPNSLLRNNGDGTFTDITKKAGLAKVFYPSLTAIFFDYDHDGKLDLYIGNQSSHDFLRFGQEGMFTNDIRYYPNQLFHNNGDGTFTDVAKKGGVENNLNTTAIASLDFNQDGFDDLLVLNLENQHRIYINQHDGTFKENASVFSLSTLAYPLEPQVFDYNNDGYDDVFLPNAQSDLFQSLSFLQNNSLEKFSSHFLFQGQSQGFVALENQSGLDYDLIFSSDVVVDANNDGFMDLFLINGSSRLFEQLPAMLFINQNGKTFTKDIFSGVNTIDQARAIAVADFNRDGSEDLFMPIIHQPFFKSFQNVLFEGQKSNNHWLQVKLIGAKSNRSAIGAKIKLEIKDGESRRFIYRSVCNSSTITKNSLIQHFGLGQALEVVSMEIQWPGSLQVQAFRNIKVDQFIEITQDNPQFKIVP